MNTNLPNFQFILLVVYNQTINLLTSHPNLGSALLVNRVIMNSVYILMKRIIFITFLTRSGLIHIVGLFNMNLIIYSDHHFFMKAFS